MFWDFCFPKDCWHGNNQRPFYNLCAMKHILNPSCFVFLSQLSSVHHISNNLFFPLGLLIFFEYLVSPFQCVLINWMILSIILLIQEMQKPNAEGIPICTLAPEMVADCFAIQTGTISCAALLLPKNKTTSMAIGLDRFLMCVVVLL